MSLPVIDLGRMAYAAAYRLQCEHVEEVLASREAGSPERGRLLLVEHDPVITVTNRQGAMGNLLAGPELLARHGVALERTDRGGDITYHGPGQIVAYPILDLNVLGLGLHAYMRLLEEAVIEACAAFGVEAGREPGATGVWVSRSGGPSAKVCAMGVRVRKWVSMHGLALNVTTNLEHFALIVPCGLCGRPVTSLEAELRERGRACPGVGEVKGVLAGALVRRVEAAASARGAARAGAGAN
ncbi:MAG: lipoyl(octanoyl) transferase LipB [Phycisphaerales bacterium]